MSDGENWYLPSEAEIQTYESSGHYVSAGPVIPGNLIARALYGVARFDTGERDWTLPLSGGFIDWRPEHGGLLRINDYVSLQNRELYDLCTYRPIAAIAGHLARTREIRLFHDQLITKLPSTDGATAVGWHVDKAYWQTCTSDRMLTAWIPLVELDHDAGGLSVIPESHRAPPQDWMRTFNEQDLDGVADQARRLGIDMKVLTPRVPLGHVSFHHGRTIHGSWPNRSRRPRIALTVHFQDFTNRYRAAPGGERADALHINDLLCRADANGLPDYSDPEICPVLWRAEFSQCV